MADAGYVLGQLSSLSWSTAAVVANPDKSKALHDAVGRDDYAGLTRMKQIPGRARAMIAVCLTQDMDKAAETLAKVKHSGYRDMWEEAVVDALVKDSSTDGALQEAVSKLERLELLEAARNIVPLDRMYVEGTKKPTDSTSREPDFKIRPEYRKSDLLRIQMPTRKPGPEPFRRVGLTPGTPGTPGTPRPDALRSKTSLRERSPKAMKSSIRSNYEASKRPKLLLDDDGFTMDPDSMAATMLRDEQKKKERELQQEKRRKEAEERKRLREEKKAEAKKKRTEAKADLGSDVDDDKEEPKGASPRTPPRTRRKVATGDGEGAGKKEAPSKDIEQVLGADTNSLTDADREEITQFLSNTKNIFAEGEEKKNFLLHQTSSDATDAEGSHVIESILFEASKNGQWRKLRRKRTVRKDEDSTPRG